jgi:hypothetical protein
MSANVLEVDFKSAAKRLRSFTNPDIKGEIPVDFPEIGSISTVSRQVINGLKRLGVSKHHPSLVVHIAYPHKNPALYPNHYPTARECAYTLLRELKASTSLSNITFRVADEICENVKLGRSHNQTVVHALTGRQIYDMHLAPDAVVPEYLLEKRNKPQPKDLFLLVDHMSEQGTTLTNLMSYVHHNGGHVLAALAGGSKAKIKQVRTSNARNLSAPFNDAARNTGRLEEMAQHFVDCEKTAGQNRTPQECMVAFERALNDCGNTVFALTDVECERVLKMPFGELMQSLSQAAPKQVRQACAP